MQRAVFLDRDGVINESVVIQGKPYPPANLSVLKLIPGVKEGLEALAQAGYLLIVITNQPDVARGTTAKETVEDIHAHLAKHLPITEFRACYHLDEHACTCRKPQPGALLSAAKAYNIDLTNSYMIGDRWRDIEAGERAGCQTFFIDYGYQEKQPTSMDFSVPSVLDAAMIILGRDKHVETNRSIKR